jgi:predicted dehydrogenase
MKKFNAAIIGCGNIYPMHANAIRNLEMVNLVSVCDIDPIRAKNASATYNCNYYTEFDKMIEDEKIDVLHICLPHYLHEKYAILAAENGINILTEKPMAIRSTAGINMINKSKTHDVNLGVIFQNRYTQSIQKLKSKLMSGELGKVLSAKLQVTWSRSPDYYSQTEWKGTWEKEGGGVIIDQAIHTIDLMNWLVGGTPEYISSYMANRMHPEIEVEDIAEGIIHYKEGFTVSFFANNYYSYDAPVTSEIHTELAVIKIEGAQVEINYFGEKLNEQWDIPKEDYEKYGMAEKTYWGTGHILQIKEFYQMLSGKNFFSVSGQEALKTQKIIDAIYDSARINRKIYL